MTGSFIGAMPVPQFLRRFMGYRVTMNDLPKGFDFSGIDGASGKIQMCQTIVSARYSLFNPIAHKLMVFHFTDSGT